jgi:uncharacterized protein (TIGR00725 family)
MGPGVGATRTDLDNAYQLGKAIAEAGHILLTGGRAEGVMGAAHKGSADAGGLSIGVLPGDSKDGMAPGVTIPIVTGLGSARNNINILTSDVIIACGLGLGTASEIALGLKAGKRVILLGCGPEACALFGPLGDGLLTLADSVETAMAACIPALNDA